MSIDAVITWVDGDDPAHIAQRRRFLRSEVYDRPLERNAVNSHRFKDHGELRYCIRSIRHYAPWIRRIHVVTDDQIPRYFNLLAARRAGVRFVPHREIFAGLELARPVFSSRSIETLIWRIRGLAERFIYFNDDTFVCAPVAPLDFFTSDGKAIIRGRIKKRRSQVDKTRMHGNSKYARAAELAEYPNDEYVFSAHVPHPMTQSVLTKAFETMRPLFLQNASYRFRDARQFNLAALHDHLALKCGLGVLRDASDVLFISSRNSKRFSETELREAFDRLLDSDIKLACLNNMRNVIARLAITEERLRELFGPPLPFEQEARGLIESLILKIQRRPAVLRFARLPPPETGTSRFDALSKPDASEKELKRRDAKTAKKAKAAVFEELLYRVCERLSARGGGFFVQVGANDGVVNDPISQVVKRYRLSGLCIEPLPAAFERLEKCYASFDNVRLANVAIGRQEGTATLYLPKLPGMSSSAGARAEASIASAERKASFLPEVALRIAARKNRVPESEARRYLWEVPVRVVPLEQVLAQYQVERVDILQIDVEGYDYEVLKQFDFDRYSPAIVNFEHQHLTPSDLQGCIAMLSARGYILFRHGRDMCGIRAFYDNPAVPAGTETGGSAVDAMHRAAETQVLR